MENLGQIPDTHRHQPIVKVSFAFVRNSFVHHLLEKCKDLRYIQALLAHGSSKTSEIYTHDTMEGFENIKNPFDTLEFEKSNLSVV